MKILNVILAEQIRRGRVTVDIPNLDMNQLTEFLHSESARIIREIEAITFAEEITDAEKVSIIQQLLS